MTHISDIQNSATVIQFIVWSFAVFGLAKSLFRSHMGEALKFWLAGKNRPAIIEARTLEWEIRSGEKFNRNRAQGDEMTAPEKLSAAEIIERRRRSKKLSSSTRPTRMLMYFMECSHCQMFWVSLICLFISSSSRMSVFGFTDVVMSAFAYSVPCAITVVLVNGLPSLITNSFRSQSNAERSSGCPGGNCGG